MIQLTVIKIEKYGHWTHMLGDDREHELQMYQATLYETSQRLFSRKDCLAFPSRGDEFFAVTNGLSINDHIEIHQKLSLIFPFDITMSIGNGRTPFEANGSAHHARELQAHMEKEEIFGKTGDGNDQSVSIIHADIEGQTEFSKLMTPYEISTIVLNLHQKMTEYFMKQNSLTFYMGGDNFMILSDDNAKKYAREFSEYSSKELGLSLNFGIGKAKKSRHAAMFATKSLDTIRNQRDMGKKTTNILQIQEQTNKNEKLLILEN